MSRPTDDRRLWKETAGVLVACVGGIVLVFLLLYLITVW
jgi:hypothetical protein